MLGHRSTGLLWTAQLVIDHPDVVVQAHRSFVEAGAEVIISASYQASVDGFVHAGLDRGAAVRALASTTALARRSGAEFVAASIGPFGASLGDGSEYHGRYAASWDEVRAFHRSRLEVLADTGPDLFAIETIPGRVEAEIVLDELARASAAPAWLCVSCRDEDTTCAGDPIGVIADVAEAGANVVAVGVNCTDSRHLTPLLRAARLSTELPFVVYPNHGGTWDAAGECWVGGGGDELVPRVAEWVALGARLIGGCCGVGPDGVARIAAVRDRW